MEAGEEIIITVAGRPSARLVAVAPRTWRQWDEIAKLFTGPTDAAWERDRDRVDQELTDPWAVL